MLRWRAATFELKLSGVLWLSWCAKCWRRQSTGLKQLVTVNKHSGRLRAESKGVAIPDYNVCIFADLDRSDAVVKPKRLGRVEREGKQSIIHIQAVVHQREACYHSCRPPRYPPPLEAHACVGSINVVLSYW